MRLGDLDALRDEIETWGCNDYDKYDFLEAINNASTVENVTIFRGCDNCELERPKGEWIYTDKEDKEKGYGGYCSNCKCDMPIFNEDWKMKYCETKFCPNCGADMKGGAKNETD